MRSPTLRAPTLLVLSALAILLCWQGVAWAFRGGDFLHGDEIGNLSGRAGVPYSQLLNFFPKWIYNDRPLGFFTARVLYDLYGFRYTPQLRCFLLIHFANCILIFLLYRRAHLSAPLSLAAVALFASLPVTAVTATYIGAVFDVLCLFFLLGSILALGKSRWRQLVSAFLFLLALRTKEFAIMAPAVLTVLVPARDGRRKARRIAADTARVLWPHYLIALVFAARYLMFLPQMKAEVRPSDPYYLNVSAAAAARSIASYTGRIFEAGEFAGRRPALVLLALAALLAYAWLRRRPYLAFAVSAYLLLLLPVSFLSNIRSPYYVYAPQVFLILAVCLLIEDLVSLIPGERVRWIAVTGIALAILACAAAFRTSANFRAGMWYARTVRGISARTAQDIAQQLPDLKPEARVYVAYRSDEPWLLAVGHCDYLNLVAGTDSIRCFLGDPTRMRRAWSADPTPGKFLLDYHPDGSFALQQDDR